MHRNLLRTPQLFTAFLLFFAISCTKIDSTTLGSDLIPAVDNVHTFADSFEVIGVQGTFNDSSRARYADYHPVGSITNDPLFGTTTSDLYLELKPGFFPYYFGNSGDTIDNVISPSLGSNNTSFDSVVLCLAVKSFYGDTTLPQTLSVYQINNSTTNFDSRKGLYGDTSYLLNYLPNGGDQFPALNNGISILPAALNDTFHYPGSKNATSVNQIRIRLSTEFLQSLIGPNRDTTFANNPTGIFRSDSLFKEKIKGFHVKTEGTGNGLFYVDLTDQATRLEVHYKKRRNNVIDTTYSAFYFSTVSTQISSHATNLQRERSGAEIASGLPDVLYIQASPGTYASLSIPGLSTLQNSIIHRAELVMEQVSDPLYKTLLPPAYMYIDIIDTASSGDKFKPVYYDANPGISYNPDESAGTYYLMATAGIDFNYFGGYARLKDDGTGNTQFYYNFNLSRHVQHIVTNGLYNYKFRLFAPQRVNYYGFSYGYKNLLADGRARIGNGNHPTRKMYMRVVYSKI